MVNHDPWTTFNALICAVIAIRVLTFRRGESRHRRWGGILAYVLIFISASIPVRTVLGDYPQADWSEVILNAVMMVAVLLTRGNVVQIFKVTRSQ
ncbi:phage holin family protein [Cedecea davisae]|uniref:phage holin family protein n=1 Tax=Cedecea davisae TaxID=158484 RepID=UPI00376EBB29